MCLSKWPPIYGVGEIARVIIEGNAFVTFSVCVQIALLLIAVGIKTVVTVSKCIYLKLH